MLTDDVVAKGYNAGAMIRDIAKEIQGGGGGQPFFATAGGVNSSGIAAALVKAKEYIRIIKKASYKLAFLLFNKLFP